MEPDIFRDFGRMEQEICSLTKTIEEMRRDLKEMKEAFHQLKGGTRALLGVAAIIGACISFFVQWFMGKH